MARIFTRPTKRVGQGTPGVFEAPVLKSSLAAAVSPSFYQKVGGGIKKIANEYGEGTKELRQSLPQKVKPFTPFIRGAGTAFDLAREIPAGALSIGRSIQEALPYSNAASDPNRHKFDERLFGRDVQSIQRGYLDPSQRLASEKGSGALERTGLGLSAVLLGAFAESPVGGPARKPVKNLVTELIKETTEEGVERILRGNLPELRNREIRTTLSQNLARTTDPQDIQRQLDAAVRQDIESRRFTAGQITRLEEEQLARLPVRPDPDTVRVAYTPASGRGGQYVVRLDSGRRDILDAYRIEGRPVVIADVPASELIEQNPAKTAEGVFTISDDLSDEARIAEIQIENELLDAPDFQTLPSDNVPPSETLIAAGLRSVDENNLGAAADGAPIPAPTRRVATRGPDGKFTGSKSEPLPGFAPLSAEARQPRTFRRPGNAITQAQDSYRAAVASGGRVPPPEGAQYVKEGMRSRPTVRQSTAQLFGDLLTPISSRLERINPELKNTLRKFEYSVAQKTQQQSEAILPLLQASRRMSVNDLKVFDLALKNGDKEVIDAVVKKYGLQKQMSAARAVLDDLYKRGNSVGMDIKFRENYFPRVVKNPDAFLAYLRGTNNWSAIQKEIIRRAEKKGVKYTDLDAEEKTAIVNSILRGYGDRVTLARPGFAKARTIETVDDTLNQFYEPFDTALTQYVIRMNDEIEGRKFFGKQLTVAPDDINTRDSIGAYVLKLIEDGKITAAQESEVVDILKARFHRGKMNGALEVFRNTEYVSTMGSPISAITQLGDIAWSLYENGWYHTAKGVGKTVTRKGITKEDLGIEQITQEFNNQTKTGKALDKVFKYTGLTGMDRLGKETLVNGQFSKLKSQAKKNDPELMRKLDLMFEDEAGIVLKELKEGRVTDNTKFMVFNTLLDFQPVAKSEMPVKYLTAPNGRIFYMLKSFTMKQFDIFRREAVDDIVSGDMRRVPKGVKNLLYLSGMFVLANATADEVKDLVLGRETSASDRLVDNIMRLLGATKYDVYKARQDGIGTQTVRKILFPTSWFDRASKDVENWLEGKEYEKGPNAGERYKLESTQTIPIGGKLFYWWFGRGAQKEEQKAGGSSVNDDGVRSFSRTGATTETRSFSR